MRGTVHKAARNLRTLAPALLGAHRRCSLKWEGTRESDNVEDRRGADSGGGSSGPVFGGRSIGIGTIVIALLGGWILGVNPLTILGLLSGGAPPAQVQQAPAQRPPADDRLARFVSTVLADTEDVWAGVFSQGGARYQEPRLALFRGATPTACGTGEAAMGPFYCPADQKVYLDLGFYETLQHQLGAPGEFAQAYVIAHEVGHHVQHLLGISDKVDSQRGRVSQVQYNQLSGAWSCRPTALPVSGRTMPRRHGKFWKMATSRPP